MVIYKDGDKARFTAHMNNEHGAFFDIDYLLASCLLETDQKDAVAKTVKASGKVHPMLEESGAGQDAGVTLREEAAYNPPEAPERVENLVVKKEKPDFPGPGDNSDLQCGSCETQFGTQEAFQQHQRKDCKKKFKKKNIECDECGQHFTTKKSLRNHKEMMHNKDINIKKERYDDPSMDPNLMYPSFSAENTENASFNEHVSRGDDVSTHGVEGYNSATMNCYGDAYPDYGASNTAYGNNIDAYAGANLETYGSRPEMYNTNNDDETYGATSDKYQSHGDDIGQIMNDVRKENPRYLDQVLSEARKRNPEELDQMLSQARKRSADDLDQMLDDVKRQNEDLYEKSGEPVAAESSAKVANPASERFYCQVESCGKSYSAKSNKQIHEKKAHNIMSERSRKKLKGSEEEQEPDPKNETLEVKEKETNIKWDELAKLRAQYYDTSPVSKTTETPDASDVSIQYNPKLESSFPRPFSPADTSMGQHETTTEEHPTFDTAPSYPNISQSNTAPSYPDISQSKYFTKNPNVITNARGKSISLFNETPAAGLSEKWRMRSFETTTKAGSKALIKHYLTPELKVLKTGLAVVEYLRLTGEMGTDQILETARALNISEGKLKKTLYE